MSVIGSNVLAGASGQAAGYEIERSLRFNSADSAYLNRTPSSAGNRKTWTWAGWVKRSFLSVVQGLFSSVNLSTQNRFQFDAGNTLVWVWNQGTEYAKTNAVFRDTSAWYHVVLAADTDNVTSSQRLQIYVNGVNQTLTTTGVTLGTQFDINTTIEHRLGMFWDSGTNYQYLSGYLADVHFIDGQALAPTDFGEYDSNNVWQPKAYSGTYGTNGFHLDFSDASSNAALGNDSSGNNNDWTVNNLVAEQPTTFPCVAFDGNGDYLSVADSADFEIGSGDFTIESWIYLTAYSIAYPPSTQNSWASTICAKDGYSGRSYNFTITGTATSYTSLNFQIFSDDTTFTTTSANYTFALNKWYHVAAVRSGTSLRLYVDGTDIGGGTNSVSSQNTSNSFYVGQLNYDGGSASTQFQSWFPGFISNLHLVKGTALYTSNFTPPTVPLTNVTNTKLLCCQSSTSATAATVAPGTITANGDVFATEVTDSTSANDSLIDTPTNYEASSGNNGGNYATLNPLKNGMSLSNGNLTATNSASTYSVALGTIGAASGKWYWEVTATTASGASIGVGDGNTNTGTYLGAANSFGYNPGGTIYGPGDTQTQSGLSTYTNGDIIGVALNLDSSEVKFYKNNSLVTTVTSLSSTTWFPAVSDGTSSGSNPTLDINFGQRPFAYTPPTGFLSLCSQNLSETVIASGSYTGNSDADGPFVYLNGVPTAMTIGGSAVTFGTGIDRLSNGFKIRSATTNNSSGTSYSYSVTTAGDPLKTSRAQSN